MISITNQVQYQNWDVKVYIEIQDTPEVYFEICVIILYQNKNMTTVITKDFMIS